MGMFNIDSKLKALGLRVYNNKMEKDDLKDIKEICEATWGHGIPSTANLERFNKLIIETAEEIAQPKITEILNLLADYSTVPFGTLKIYDAPKTVKPKLKISAKGTGVDLARISGEEKKIPATPTEFSYGAYYEMTTFMADPVKAFNDAVNQVADAKINFYFKKVFECLKKSIENGEIPVNNCKEGASLKLADFQKVEQTMIRLTGGRPLFVADIALINSFANQIPTAQASLMTDKVKDMLRDDLVPTQISKTIAMPFPNNWIDEANSKVEFDQTQGFMFPGSYNGKKPFGITEFGNRREYSKVNPETEQVELIIHFTADITLINGRYLGSIKDTAVTL